MDAQSESCEPPPCDPQPPGKIRKAFKLFGKRKPGSGVASIFSIRGKGDGVPKSPPSRSKTLDGLNEPTAPEAEAEQVDLDQEEESQQEDAPMDEFTSGNMKTETTPTRQSISSLTSAKSLSFLNMLRKGRRGVSGERQAQTESQRPGRQRKGLKGLFGNIRWPSKEKEAEEEAEPGPPLLASRSNSVEIIKESLTLTPGPTPRSAEEQQQEGNQQLPTTQEGPTSSKDAEKVSEATKPQKDERLSTLLGDISSILSFDTLTPCGDIVADVEAEWVKASCRMEGETTLKVDDSEKTSSASTRSKPSPSPTSTLSPTSCKPSPTLATKPISSPVTTKPITSPLTKPASSPTSSSLTRTTPSMPSAPIIPTPSASPLTKPTPAPSAMPITQPTPTPTPKAQTTPIVQPTPTPFSNTESAQDATSSPTFKSISSPAKPALSPKSSPELKPTTIQPPSITSASMTLPIPTSTPSPSPVTTPISETSPSPTTSTTPDSFTKTKPSQAAKPTHESKHGSSTSAKHLPPFDVFGKPNKPPAPTKRPKLITTFGLSTSRNTAPISKPEPEQPTGQTTKSTSQSDKTGSASNVRKTSISESSTKPIQPSTSSNSIQRAEEDARMHLRKDVRQEGIDMRDSVATQNITKTVVKKGTMGKPATLSKIPVSGGGRPAKQRQREAQPNGDEDHSNPPTPVNEEQSPFSLSRESSSKEALSDISTESGAVTPTLGQEDIGLTSARPTASATSLSRESKIPVKHGSSATYHSMPGRMEAARSKIPVSKMPVRRTSNKPAPTASTASAPRK
ncbi:APC membrane recruitment protein 2 [Triplophysa rosa]|uniref:APC membrane recruitment protein 2-like n=1 Tax=Triplophysa rosa TaxID=992332 RepID=A0A9W7TBH5_TRIRA|nr:APC membrane recruitment protein 2 [Triplophysa rosa]KAI7793721.1 putative APC membrane recruitment protein 2-like [Triplophysa rosa]